MVDLGGYVIILVETKDKKIKLYGSPADKSDLEIGDEILEVNGKTLSDATHAEIISHIHQCIRSRTICLRVKRKSGHKLASDLADSNIVQDAFVIAVEQRARERLQRLSALRKIKPVDMTQLCQQLSVDHISGIRSRPSDQHQDCESADATLHSLLQSESVYVTSLPGITAASSSHHHHHHHHTRPPVLKSAQHTDHLPPTESIAAEINSDPYPLTASATAAGVLDVSTELELCHYRPVSPVTIQPLRSRHPSSSTTDPAVRRALCAADRASSVDTDRNPVRPSTLVAARSDGSLVTVGGSSAVVGGASVIGGGASTFVAGEPVVVGGATVVSGGASPFVGGDSAVVGGAFVRQCDMEMFRARAGMGSDWNGTNGHTSNRGGSNGHGSARYGSMDRQRNPHLSHVDSKRSSKESLSSHKSARTTGSIGGVAVASAIDAASVEAAMQQLDRAPYREMAVDVPESFVARVKTPPRYPPPHRVANHLPPSSAPRVETVFSGGRSANQQSDRIRKQQEEARRDREMRERRGRENDLLRSSLRDSERLRQLESCPAPTGQFNNGFVAAESLDPPANTDIDVEELLSALEQAQCTLRDWGRQDLQQQLLSARQLLSSDQFRQLLSVHNKVQQLWCQKAPAVPVCLNSKHLINDVMNILHDTALSESSELIELLTTFEMEAVMYAHDQIASRVHQQSASLSPNLSQFDDPVQLYTSHVHQYTDPRVRVVTLEKSSEPLGATVKNEGDSVLVGRIVKGGTAEKSGLLRPGDEILEVNGIEMRGKSVDDVCDVLAGMSGSLVFIILPGEEEPLDKPKQAQTVMHVKAHFDYMPDDDIYLPCREIGLSFEKGDILHVTSQEDADWWQATRDGDDAFTLSGLVPSLQFQTQRLAAQQALIGEGGEYPGEYGGQGGGGSSSTLLCARRTNRRRKHKKRLMYGGGGVGGTASGGESADECDGIGGEYDPAEPEVLTYEEVGLYYPRANRKRPVVLIGPPNIGRHELRQKLMEDADRFAAAVPHTSRARKENEVNGQDYHFISRQQFEADIANRVFVEHGQYEKAYYGTSITSIRAVIATGKTCLLNLHPHSLRILKRTDLKPFVVFVAPPSLDKLRLMKQRSTGQPVRDDHLKMIIERARQMEETYGHYFDTVLVNSDLLLTYQQLLQHIAALDRQPQWVPIAWLRQDST